ncbi:hypothetical protein ACF0H5_011743 [Mactra antiquata]
MDCVTDQPRGINGSSEEKSTPEKLPRSLTLLSSASEVSVTQHIDPVEVVLCCFARPCRYSVYVDGSEQHLLYIQEVSECYARQIMGAARGLTLKFSDSDMIDVIKVIRPQTCSRGCLCCCCCCALPTLDIQSPPGVSVASVTERRTVCMPTYDINDKDGNMLYTVRLCCYTCRISLCSQLIFEICDVDGVQVAQLCKNGNFKECVGATNNFTIKFLKDISVIQKVILLGSMFLVDYHYFERQNRCCC